MATRFVRACPRGHVDDLDWHRFVHKPGDRCLGELRLDESGTTGDLSELIVRCSCGAQRVFAEAKLVGTLGPCSGQRPWLGTHAREACEEHARLLIRTATNAWFPQIVSVLSLPDRGKANWIVSLPTSGEFFSESRRRSSSNKSSRWFRQWRPGWRGSATATSWRRYDREEVPSLPNGP